MAKKMAESQFKAAINSREEEEVKKDTKKATINRIASLNNGVKNKPISAKVNEVVYKQFTDINKAMGLSNNSAINMIINKYVRENKGILDLD